jgi:hypothetical protein
LRIKIASALGRDLFEAWSYVGVDVGAVVVGENEQGAGKVEGRGPSFFFLDIEDGVDMEVDGRIDMGVGVHLSVGKKAASLTCFFERERGVREEPGPSPGEGLGPASSRQVLTWLMSTGP